MPVYKKPEAFHYSPDSPIDIHFHDYDETWIVTRGRCDAFMVDRDGARAEFPLEEGDVWMVEAGTQHGCKPLPPDGVDFIPVSGTIPVGSHEPGHYHMEEERYLPTLRLEKVPLDRYGHDRD